VQGNKKQINLKIKGNLEENVKNNIIHIICKLYY
jgi:hypothetical protein